MSQWKSSFVLPLTTRISREKAHVDFFWFFLNKGRDFKKIVGMELRVNKRLTWYEVFLTSLHISCRLWARILLCCRSVVDFFLGKFIYKDVFDMSRQIFCDDHADHRFEVEMVDKCVHGKNHLPSQFFQRIKYRLFA